MAHLCGWQLCILAVDLLQLNLSNVILFFWHRLGRRLNLFKMLNVGPCLFFFLDFDDLFVGILRHSKHCQLDEVRYLNHLDVVVMLEDNQFFELLVQSH